MRKDDWITKHDCFIKVAGFGGNDGLRRKYTHIHIVLDWVFTFLFSHSLSLFTILCFPLPLFFSLVIILWSTPPLVFLQQPSWQQKNYGYFCALHLTKSHLEMMVSNAALNISLLHGNEREYIFSGIEGLIVNHCNVTLSLYS